MSTNIKKEIKSAEFTDMDENSKKTFKIKSGEVYRVNGQANLDSVDIIKEGDCDEVVVIAGENSATKGNVYLKKSNGDYELVLIPFGSDLSNKASKFVNQKGWLSAWGMYTVWSAGGLLVGALLFFLLAKFTPVGSWVGLKQEEEVNLTEDSITEN